MECTIKTHISTAGCVLPINVWLITDVSVLDNYKRIITAFYCADAESEATGCDRLEAKSSLAILEFVTKKEGGPNAEAVVLVQQ